MNSLGEMVHIKVAGQMADQPVFCWLATSPYCWLCKVYKPLYLDYLPR